MDLVRQLKDVRFDLAVRGYDCAGVDTFLAKLRGEVAELQERADRAEEQLAGVDHSGPSTETETTLRRTLVLAQRLADETEAEAKSAAAELLDSATADAEVMRSQAEAAALETRKQADAVLASAQSDAEEMRSASEAEAEKTREQARLHAHELLASAERAGGERVQQLEASAQQEATSMREPVRREVEELEGVRAQLLKDIADLESHLDAQRVRVRHAVDALRAGMSGSIEDLERVAEDENLMAPEPAPEHSNASAGDVPAAPVIEFAEAVSDGSRDSAPDLGQLDEQAATSVAEAIAASEAEEQDEEPIRSEVEAEAPAAEVEEEQSESVESGYEDSPVEAAGLDTEAIPVVEAPPAPVVEAPQAENDLDVTDVPVIDEVPDDAVVGDDAPSSDAAAFVALGAAGGAAALADASTSVGDDAVDGSEAVPEVVDGAALATAADLEEAELVVLEDESDPLFGTDIGETVEASEVDDASSPEPASGEQLPQPVDSGANGSTFTGRLAEALDEVPIDQ